MNMYCSSVTKTILILNSTNTRLAFLSTLNRLVLISMKGKFATFIHWLFISTRCKKFAHFLFRMTLCSICDGIKSFLPVFTFMLFQNYVSSSIYMFSYWNFKFFRFFILCVSIWLVINLWYSHLALLLFKGRYMKYVLCSTANFA